MPLVWAEASEDVKQGADGEVGDDDVHPDLWCQGVEEREETWAFATGSLEQDAYAEVHERLSEVYYLFTQVVDRQRCNGQIGLLSQI